MPRGTRPRQNPWRMPMPAHRQGNGQGQPNPRLPEPRQRASDHPQPPGRHRRRWPDAGRPRHRRPELNRPAHIRPSILVPADALLPARKSVVSRWLVARCGFPDSHVAVRRHRGQARAVGAEGRRRERGRRWPRRVADFPAAGGLQRRTVPSPPAEAMRFPAG